MIGSVWGFGLFLWEIGDDENEKEEKEEDCEDDEEDEEEDACESDDEQVSLDEDRARENEAID